MFEIPRYKILKTYNFSGEVCLDCENHIEEANTCLLNKVRKNLLNYTEDEKRLKEEFKRESFDFEDNKDYDREKLEQLYEKVHDCCQHCGAYHTEKCFLNNTREALQLLLYGEIIPWDGLEFKKED